VVSDNKPYLPITGTFIDEMTVDIPSQNWGPREWATEFDTFADAGIDTVILIRAGCGDRLACPSAAIAGQVPTLPVYIDLVRLFLDLAAERQIAFYLGLYDSNRLWHRYDWRTEVSLNLAFIDEVCGRYADSPAFKGWYLPHETTDSSLRILDINTELAGRIKSVAPGLPVLVSPFFAGRSDLWDGADPRSRPRDPAEHARIWEEIFQRYSGLVDYCAFQDGTADPLRVPEYFAASAEVATRYGIRSWANVETFDRDMPIRFPPADWRRLAHRLDAVQPYVEKVISFEFSHFMSPNSTWPSARLLYTRYREFLQGKNR
jgi:hypothetical protein